MAPNILHGSQIFGNFEHPSSKTKADISTEMSCRGDNTGCSVFDPL